jgi:hypothetical protein
MLTTLRILEGSEIEYKKLEKYWECYQQLIPRTCYSFATIHAAQF